VVRFSGIRTEGELEKIRTFVWRLASSGSRFTIPARLKTFFPTATLETQFCEPGDPLRRGNEFLKYLRLVGLSSSSEGRSLSSDEMVTVLGLVDGRLNSLDCFEGKGGRLAGARPRCP